jgi:replicative DNA helicase
MIEFDLRESVRSNIAPIDELLGDGFSTGLHLVSGVSGTAKTAFLLQTAQKCKFPTIYLNTEMNNREITKRLVAITTRVDLNGIDKMTSEERTKLVEITSSENNHLDLEDGNAGFISINYLKNKISQTVHEQNPDTVLLVIDSFNEWVNTAKTEFSSLTDGELCAKLKSELIDLSKEFNVTVLISAQKKGTENDFIEELEFASNTHLIFNWEKGGRPDRDGLKYLNMFFKKNRSGPSGKNKIVKFNGGLQEFSI